MVNRSLFKVAELNHTGSEVGKADIQLWTTSPPVIVADPLQFW